jgi:two-component system, NtrC family, response regulator GlrR
MSTRPQPRDRILVIGGDLGEAALAGLVGAIGCAAIHWDGQDPAPWREHAAGLIVVGVGGGQGGRAVLEGLRAQRPRGPSLALVAEGAGDEGLRAAAETVDDFLSWPSRRAELDERIRRLVAAVAPGVVAGAAGSPRAAEDARPDVAPTARRLARERTLRQLIGDDPAFRRLVDSLARLAADDGTVLITGETGTGKELCARALHQLGPRPGGPFIAVDCGALPDQLLENELYGHAAGAFTDARTSQLGLVGMADGGVLFLDEVDALSLTGQAKLLRFLQDRSYRPLGGGRLHHSDARVVAATNRDLAALVQQRSFRADLLFRLNVLQLQVIPLRARHGDIPLLADHFLRLHDAVGPQRFSARALDKLRRHDWPGNVRELENAVRRAQIAAPADAAEIDAADVDVPADAKVDCTAGLDLTAAPEPEPSHAREQTFRLAKARAIAEFERRFVSDLMRAHHGNITQAARAVRKDRRALGRLVKKYLDGQPGS